MSNRKKIRAIEMKNVLVTGVFDILHPGHLFIIEEAAKLGKVNVIVARDSTVIKLKHRPPIIPEEQRLTMIKGLKHVETAVLGYEGKHFLERALELHPDIIVLGPNQHIDEVQLRKDLEKFRHPEIEVVRISTLFNGCELCSSSRIKEKIYQYYPLKELPN
jgi:FAD synthetase